MAEGTGHLFLPCADLGRYTLAVSAMMERSRAPVPFLYAERDDLLVSARNASALYAERRPPPRADVGVVLGPDRAVLAELRPMLAPLAADWVPDLATAVSNGRQSLLIVGLYEDLSNDLLYWLSDTASGPFPVYVLTGRDIPSLSWMLAKQYMRPAADLVAEAILSDVDRPRPRGRAEVLGSKDFASQDIGQYLLDRRWRKILFHGHGKDDYLNLGDWTLCGLNDAASTIGPVTLRPRCGYGYPCFKPTAKLIQVLGLTAAEIVLSACNSGPLPDAAFYASRYQLLLASVDGTAQSVVAAAKAHDSGRPENEVFLNAGAGQQVRVGAGPSLADGLNESLRDIHPYGAFVQYGFPVSASTEDEDGQHSVPAIPDAGIRPVAWQRELLRTALERAFAFLDSNFLPPSHPLRSRLAKFTKKYFDIAAFRHFKDSVFPAGDLLNDLQSLDYAMARTIVKDPEDAILNSLEYWGKRSQLSGEAVPTVCGCGRPAQQFGRSGIIRAIPATICVACTRCGYAHMRLEGGLSMTTSFPEQVRVGGDGVAGVRYAGGRRSGAQLGIFVPPYLRDTCAVSPAAVRVRVPASGRASTSFTLRFAAEAIPQIYYYTVFAIQDLSVAIVRTHFELLPSREGSPETRAGRPDRSA